MSYNLYGYITVKKDIAICPLVYERDGLYYQPAIINNKLSDFVPFPGIEQYSSQTKQIDVKIIQHLNDQAIYFLKYFNDIILIRKPSDFVRLSESMMDDIERYPFTFLELANIFEARQIYRHSFFFSFKHLYDSNSSTAFRILSNELTNHRNIRNLYWKSYFKDNNNVLLHLYSLFDICKKNNSSNSLNRYVEKNKHRIKDAIVMIEINSIIKNIFRNAQSRSDLKYAQKHINNFFKSYDVAIEHKEHQTELYKNLSRRYKRNLPAMESAPVDNVEPDGTVRVRNVVDDYVSLPRNYYELLLETRVDETKECGEEFENIQAVIAYAFLLLNHNPLHDTDYNLSRIWKALNEELMKIPKTLRWELE